MFSSCQCTRGQQQAARDAATRPGRRGCGRTVCDDLDAYAPILPLVVPLPPKVVPHELLTWSGLYCWLAHDNATVGSRDCARTHRLVTHTPSAFTASPVSEQWAAAACGGSAAQAAQRERAARGFFFHAPARPAHRAPHSAHLTPRNSLRAPHSAHLHHVPALVHLDLQGIKHHHPPSQRVPKIGQ